MTPPGSGGSYRFSWNDNLSPIDAVEGNDNLVLAMTALSKLGYSTFNDTWKGKSVAEFVNPQTGGYYEKGKKEKIWRLEHDNVGNRYSKFYTDVIGDYTIYDYYDDNGFSGFCAACFQAPDGKYIISYRGSEGLDAFDVVMRILVSSYQTSNDWATDLDFALRNTLSDQFDLALAYYFMIADQVGPENIVLTGHSLGGALAGFVSICTGARAFPVDGAVGRIIDTTFWEASPYVTGFSGTDRYNFVNLTDELGANKPFCGFDGGDLIQAYELNRYPMLTFRSIHAKDATDLEAGSFQSEHCGSHHQMSFLDYDETSGRYVLGRFVQQYDADGIWTKDITNHTSVVKFGAGRGLVSGLLTHNIFIALGDSLASGFLAEKMMLFRMGRILVGTSADDTLSPPGIWVVDRIPNVVVGGVGSDRLIGHTAGDFIVANGSGTYIDGEGGADVYFLNIARGNVTIHDPGGDDTLYLNTWDLDRTTLSEDADNVYISDSVRTVTINKHRSWYSKDTIEVLIPDYQKKQCVYFGDVALFSTDEISLMEETDADQMKYVRIDGVTEITICDRDGNALGTFSNQDGDCIAYSDFAYYYGYNNETGDSYADVYLINEAYSVRIAGDETCSTQIMQYDESESTITGGCSVEDITLDDVAYLEIVAADHENEIYTVDENEARSEFENVAAFSYAVDVTLSDSELTLACGESSVLTATAAPVGSLLDGNWVSSDPQVASVEDGLVTAKAPGSAEIRYMTGSGITSTCAVTVPNRIQMSVVPADGMLYYVLDGCDDLTARLIVSWYNDQGRMAGCEMVNDVESCGQIAVPAAERYKVFLVDSDTVFPLCEAWDSKA